MTATPNHDPALLLADHGFVRSLAQKLCQDSDTADDIAQEAMVAALREGPADGKKRRSWLASVTRHLVFNHSRKNRRRVAREQLAAKNLTSTTPAEIVAEEQQRAMVVAAVLKLPEPFREVVLLRYYRGLDTKECAQQLEIPEATVRTRLKRGIERLRAELDKQHGGDRRQWVTALLPFALPSAPAAIGARTVILVAAALLLGTFVALPFWIEADLPPPTNSTIASAMTATASSGEASDALPDTASAQREDRRNQAADGTTIRERITGTVTDSLTKQALANARISMTAVLPYEEGVPIAALGEVETDNKGAFAFSLAPLATLHPLTVARIDLYYRLDAAGYRPVEDSYGMWEMKGSSEAHLNLELRPAAVTKGRIVDKNGKVIPYANLLVLSKDHCHKERAEESGYFVLDLPPKNVEASEFTLVAFDDAHGYSQPAHIKVDSAHETVVPDLAVTQRHGCIEGIVRDRNGRGVPDISIRCTGDNRYAAYEIHGIRIEEFGSVLGKRYVSTNKEGRFSLRALPPGTYTLRGPGDHQVVELGAFATQHVAFTTDQARIKIRCEDPHGMPLHADYHGVYIWQGDAAYKARSEFQQAGFSSELMATAGKKDQNELDNLQPPAFVVVEATWNGRGPLTGTCFLAADQFYGEVLLQTSDLPNTGSLQIDVRDANGAPIKTLIARASRLPGGQTVPIEFGDAVGDKGITSLIYPDTKLQGKWWQWIPADGLVQRLPVGEVSLEIIAAPELMHGRVFGSAHDVIFRTVTIRSDRTEQLAITATKGCLPRVEIATPELDETEELRFLSVDLTFTRKSDGKRIARSVRPLQGWDTPKIKDGAIHGRLSHAIPPGLYTVRPSRFRLESKLPRGQVDKSIQKYVVCRPTDVEITESMAPIKLTLTIKVVKR